MSKNPQYRPDIDGLRALAVLPVILFHAGVAGFGGGYVGVDVFFVISGYLITSIIVREIEDGSFTFLGFWERRARRILPAVTTVVIATLIAGWFLLLPYDFRHLGQEVIAQTGFASNILFWLKADYFDPAAELKPLLHTWSLSVEEQFYLLYPAVLLLITLRAPRHRLGVLAGIGALSFAASLHWMQVQPSSAFYFLPARAWELLVGVLLALAALKPPASRAWREALAWTGLGLVAIPVWLYDDQTRFPGVTALVPCLGAGLLIFANAAPNSVSRALSLPPVVGVGLLSYSLYLWHWPIVVFQKYLDPAPFSPGRVGVLVAATALLSVLSYRFIETPIRRRQVLRSRTALFSALAIPIVAIAGFGYLTQVTEGFPSRWPEDVRRFAAGLSDTNPKRARCVGRDERQILEDDLCHLGSSDSGDERPSVLVWGDSHADALLPAIDAIADSRGVRGRQIVNDGCPPLLSDHVRVSSYCRGINRAVVEWIGRFKPDRVFIIGRWDRFTHLVSGQADHRQPSLLLALVQTIDRLAVPREKVVVFRQVPRQAGDVPRLLVNALAQGQDVRAVGKTLEEHRRERLVESSVFASLESLGVRTLDPARALCNAAVCPASVGPYAAYFDDNHLSARGAMQLSRLIEAETIQGTNAVVADTAAGRLLRTSRLSD